MTIIAWDGYTLAADRNAELYCSKAHRTKIRRIGPYIYGATGEARSFEQVYAWLEAGGDLASWPRPVKDDSPIIMCIRPDGVWLYQDSPIPFKLDNKQWAIGSGSDAALATMYLGYDALRAVEVACAVCTGCGGGIDTLELEAQP